MFNKSLKPEGFFCGEVWVGVVGWAVEGVVCVWGERIFEGGAYRDGGGVANGG